MRSAFIRTITELARSDPRLIIITPDMGFSLFESFATEFPDRLINSGIAEQNSIGMAAGLALCGKVVYVYSIVPFVTMRPFEQVRIDTCYHNLPIKLVGSGGGLTYGSLGPTHHSVEDISLMRSLPNMTVYCPGDPVESELCTTSAHSISGPAYIRLGRGHGDPIVHKSKPTFQFGKAIKLQGGADLAIISTGNMLNTSVLASQLLNSAGKQCAVYSMPIVKPIDADLVCSLASKEIPIFTLEEHSILGGLGTSVSELLSESEFKTTFKRLGLPDRFCKTVGSQDYLRKDNQLDPESVVKTILGHL